VQSLTIKAELSAQDTTTWKQIIKEASGAESMMMIKKTNETDVNK